MSPSEAQHLVYALSLAVFAPALLFFGMLFWAKFVSPIKYFMFFGSIKCLRKTDE